MAYYNYLGQVMPESATESGRIAGTSAGGETMVAPAGDTSVSGEGGGDLLIGSAGDNRFWITDTKDVIQEAPNAGIDTEIGWTSLKLADNVENLQVNGGFNYALGNSLNNLIVVDDAIHWLDGGAGDDVLVGAATARDTFVAKYGQGNDVIYNWNGNSQLQLLGTNLDTPTEIRAAMTQQGSDIVLAMGGGETLTIRNTTIASIQDRQFLTPLDTSKLGAVTFDDEFNSLSLWDPNTGTGTWQTNFGGNPKDQWAYTLVSNGETEAYVAPGYQGRGEQDIGVNPFSVNNGVVTITAAPVSSEDAYATWNRDYTSGMLNTLGSFQQKYGYFEMRAELPNVAGTWPAFWMMSNPFQPNAEADIMEALGSTPTVDYRRAFGGDNGTQTQSDNVLREDPTGFHTYGMLWTPTTVSFYYDGVEVLTGATPSTWTSPMALIINMATGGWGGAADTANFPAEMNIDYVRAYALADGSTQVVTSTPTPIVATLHDDGATSGQTNLAMTFADGSGSVAASHIAVYESKPTVLPSGHTFVIYEDAGAIFGAVSNGSTLAAPTALIAGDNVHIFTGAGTWLTEGKVVFAYTQPNASGGTDVWDMVFDTTKLTFVRQDLGAGTGQDIHFVATGDGGFAVSWEAPDHTISARGYDEYAYGGDIPGWYGPVRTITGDFTGVDANGHVIATAADGAQHLYSLTNASIDTSGNTAAPPPVQPTIALSTPSVAHAEGASGDTAFSYVVTRSGDTTTAVTVNYAVAGSGTNPANAADFHGGVLPTGTLSFAAGETSKTIVVNVAGDTTVETDETFTLTLSGPSGATLGTATATGTITNDDTASTGGGSTTSGQVVNSSGYGATLNGGAGNDTLNAGQGPDVLTGGAGADSFAFKNLPWNAGHVTDFTVGTDKLDLSALMSASGYTGSNPITDHYVTLQSDGSGGTKVYYDTDGAASGNTIQYLITDLDHVATTGLTWAQLSGGGTTTGGGGTTTPPASPTVALTTTSVTHAEGASGDTAFSYIVTRSGDTSATSTVSWAVAGSGTNAANAADFHGGVLPTGTLSFAAGETSKTIVVNVAGDATVESDETFTLTLSGPSGATLGTATATGTITNDDTASAPASPTVALTTTAVTHAEGASGDTAFSYTVTRSGDTSAASTVNYAVAGSGSNPANAADFHGGVLPTGTLSFAAGETSKTIVVNVAGDTTVETDETFTLTLSGPSGATLGAATAAGTITNDDTASTGGGTGGTGGSSNPGVVVNSSGYGAALNGGSGNDTLNAGQGPDVLTGGAGADSFAFKNLPWNAGHVTDFTVGTDKLDLSALMSASGYTGSNPITDHYVTLQSDGSGGTKVYYDTDGAASGNTIQYLITDLDHVATTGLTWAQLSGGGTTTGGGGTTTPPASPTVALTTTSVTHAEGASGDTAFSYIVTRSGDTSATSTVSWAVAGSGTNAANATDFHGGVLPTGTLSFAAGETSKTIVVNVAGDATVESDETFTLTLSGPSGATLGTATATGTITNDDTASTGGGSTTSGQVVNSSGYGATLNGGAGADTLNAGQGPDVLTGGAGADHFVYNNLPWNPGHITDFTPGTDVLDLRPLFAAAGYTGTNPIADHTLTFQSDGSGNTQVLFDADGPGGNWPTTITTLDHISPSQIGSGDFLFH